MQYYYKDYFIIPAREPKSVVNEADLRAAVNDCMVVPTSKWHYGHVYLMRSIGHSPTIYKIGYSSDVNGRIYTLRQNTRRKCGFSCEPVDWFMGNLLVERVMHFLFRKKAVPGLNEFFALEQKDVDWFQSLIAVDGLKLRAVLDKKAVELRKVIGG